MMWWHSLVRSLDLGRRSRWNSPKSTRLKLALTIAVYFHRVRAKPGHAAMRGPSACIRNRSLV